MTVLNRRLVVALGVLVLGVWAMRAGTAAGDDPGWRRFDFQPAGGPLAAGFQAVTPADGYTPATGFGFTAPPAAAKDSSGHTWRIFGRVVTVEDAIPAAVLSDASRDAVVARGDFTFRADVPPGDYDVTLWLGDISRPLFQLAATVNGREVRVERLDVLITRGRLGVTTLPDGRTPSIGNAVPRTVRVAAPDGRIVVTVGAGDSRDPVSWDYTLDECPSVAEPEARSEVLIPAFSGAALQAVTMHPAADAPIVASADGQPDHIAIGAAAPDLAAALAPAVAAYNAGRVAEARGLFEALKGPEAAVAKAAGLFWVAGHPATIEGETELLGEAHRLLAGHLMRQQEDWAASDLLLQVDLAADAEGYRRRYGYGGVPAVENLGRSASIAEQFQPGHPYFLKGQILWLRNRGGLDPRRCTMSWERAQWLARSLDSDWGGVNPYVHLYATDEWRNEGRPWTFVDWGAVAGPGPDWARALVRSLNGWLDVFEWWAIHRQTPAGEIGGGWTDDVEIVPAFGLAAYALDGASDISEYATLRFTDGIWNSPVIDRERGYEVQYADVEHSAEPTGNSLQMYPMLRYGDPEGIERIMKSARTFATTFLTTTVAGNTRFRGNHMSATAIARNPDHRVDIPLNGRVVAPFPWLVWYSSNPGAEEPLRRWVEAWLTSAASPAKAKPTGVFPHAVWVPTDEIGYPGTDDWYSRDPGHGQFAEFPAYHFYLYNLAAFFYLRTGDDVFRAPFDALQQLGQAWLDAGRPGVGGVKVPPPGEADVWAGGKLAAVGAHADAVFQVAEATASGDWDRYLNRFATSYSRFARSPRTATLMADRMADMNDQLAATWPFRTTEGVMTDRILIPGWYNVISYYIGANVASMFYGLPRQAVTWAGTSRLFAAAVHEATGQSLAATVYLFSDAERNVGLRLWNLEEGGSYVLEAGPAPDLAADADSIVQRLPFDYEHRGDEVRFLLPGRQVYALRIRQVARGRPSPSRGDLAIAPRDVTYDAAAAELRVRVHNIGTAPAAEVAVAVWPGRDLGGAAAGAGLIGAIEAPTDLVPRVVEVAIPFEARGLPSEVTVAVDPGDEVPEITEANNIVTAVIGGQAPIYPPPMLIGANPLRLAPGETISMTGRNLMVGAEALAFGAPVPWLAVNVAGEDGATLTAHRDASPGVAPISLRNPDGQESNPLPITIGAGGTSPAPRLYLPVLAYTARR